MTESMNREQPAPGEGTGHDCWLLTIEDMKERRLMGQAKYGRVLRPDNGHDHLLDAYQEALDLAVYLRTAIAQRGQTVPVVQRPRRITLCGSTRFKKAFIEWNARLTLAGNVVLSVALHGHKQRTYPPPEQKRLLDAIHFAKIDAADEIFVLDVKLPFCTGCNDWLHNMTSGMSHYCEDRPYIGESTRNEIAYATATGKGVYFLSVNYPDWTEADCLHVED